MHFGPIRFVLTTLFACGLCAQILAWSSGAWRRCRYAHLLTDCGIILRVILTLHFCQTFEHRHEIMLIWAPNLPHKTVLTVVQVILGVCLPNFGAVKVCTNAKWLSNNIQPSCNNKSLPKFQT